MQGQELIKKDKKCSKLDDEIAMVESDIKTHLNDEQYKLFMEYEKLITEWHSKTGILIYKQGLDDRVKRTGV